MMQSAQSGKLQRLCGCTQEIAHAEHVKYLQEMQELKRQQRKQEEEEQQQLQQAGKAAASSSSSRRTSKVGGCLSSLPPSPSLAWPGCPWLDLRAILARGSAALKSERAWGAHPVSATSRAHS